MGEVLYVDFRTKDRSYTKGGGIDDLVGLTEPPAEDTAPSEMPFCAPTEDSA
jgi:hypothetical protein